MLISRCQEEKLCLLKGVFLINFQVEGNVTSLYGVLRKTNSCSDT
jgi:hypothetical protein